MLIREKLDFIAKDKVILRLPGNARFIILVVVPRFVAFLRAINVGGRNVTMDKLRQLFEAAGFDNIETFIASGNVLFASPWQDTKAVE